MAGSLTDEDQVRRLIDDTVGEYGRIDILVNLAGGLSRYKPAIEHSLDDWHVEVDNNLLSAFLTSRAAFPLLQAAGNGVIINFARAGQPQANMVAYNCAKAGIEALTRTLALEGRDLGIRVNAIAPGLVDTASNIAAMKPKDLKRWTKREDIAETVVFLASPTAAGITGQVVAVRLGIIARTLQGRPAHPTDGPVSRWNGITRRPACFHEALHPKKRPRKVLARSPARVR